MNEGNYGSDNMQSGSPESMDTDPTLNGGAGQSGETIDPEMYQQLEQKLGIQGKELGDFRNFFEEISPLLEILDEDPDLTRAILDKKISSQMLKPVLEGSVPLKTATDVTKAHEEVKKELGKVAYERLSPKDIEDRVFKRMEQRFNDLQTNVTQNLDEADQMRNFENEVTDFIESTPDFPELAEDIDNWLNAHPHITDIEVAYDAVKGKVLAEYYAEEEDVRAAEKQKDFAANAGGGQGQATGHFDNQALVDRLIGRTSNPNIFGS